MSAIVTLTTDWGLLDHYVGAVKGTLLRRLSDINIVDITHQIPPFDIKKATFILRNAFPHFPAGTIHIIGVSTEESETTPHIVVSYRGHYFIGADNGIFSLLFDEMPESIIELQVPQDTRYFTFSSRDRFVKTAIHLALGKPIEELGLQKTELTTFMTMRPVIVGDQIQTRVLYIDNYENVFLNLPSAEFEKACRERKFSLFVKGREHKKNRVDAAYGDVPEGEMAVLYSTTGFIEVAVNRGNAASLLGFRTDDVVIIEFYE